MTGFEPFNLLGYVWFDERYRLEYSSLIALTTFLALSVYLSIQLYVSSLKCFHDYNSQVNHVVQWALDCVKDLEFDLSCCILFECGVSCSYYFTSIIIIRKLFFYISTKKEDFAICKSSKYES